MVYCELCDMDREFCELGLTIFNGGGYWAW
jgi:hypothetical protein